MSGVSVRRTGEGVSSDTIGAKPEVAHESERRVAFSSSDLSIRFDDAAPIALVPGDLLAQASHATAAWQPRSIRAASQLTGPSGAHAERVIGPALLTYADATTLRACNVAHPVRRLHRESEADRQHVLALRAACTPEEWEAGGSDIDQDIIFGVFVGAALAGMAGYEVWDGRIAHIAIITQPAQRRNAFGKAAVLAAAQHALSKGLVPQYRTLESNPSSLRIAMALGLVPAGGRNRVSFPSG